MIRSGYKGLRADMDFGSEARLWDDMERAKRGASITEAQS